MCGVVPLKGGACPCAAPARLGWEWVEEKAVCLRAVLPGKGAAVSHKQASGGWGHRPPKEDLLGYHGFYYIK